MTLRRRVTLMSALVVGATLVLASGVCYLVMRGELRGQIDDSLREQGAQVARIPPQRVNADDFPRRVPQPQRRTGASQAYVQFVSADGVARRPPGTSEPRLPITGQTKAIAEAGRGRTLVDAQPTAPTSACSPSA